MIRLLVVVAAASALVRAPEPPRIVGLAHVRIQTSDLAKARRFYGDLLGYDEMRPGADTHVAIFRVNGRQRLIIQDGLPADRDERLMNIAFETTDVDALQQRLAAAHVELRPRIDADAAGPIVDALDPDGHHVQLVQVASSSPAGVRTAGDRRLSTRMLHAGLIVRDVAAADRFYKELLGFSEIWRGGRTEGVTSWINMRVPDGTDYLEYMLTAAPPDRRQLGTAHHIALLVPSIQDALELVRERTAGDDPNHRANPQIGRNNRWQLNLYDPDGTRVELMEPWTVR
jgi:catechol 2,3-dioxygenase-like lactoylglutathione lyase family enzyme